MCAGLVENHPDLSTELKEVQLEAAWQLGQWSQIEQEVTAAAGADKTEEGVKDLSTNDSKSSNWNVSLSKLLYFVRENDSAKVVQMLDIARREQVRPLYKSF